MRSHHWTPARGGRGIGFAFVLALAGTLLASGSGHRHSLAATQPEVRLESTIFSFDGSDFVRTRTTLVTEEGTSAVNTKLDHDSPAFHALLLKRSYSGNTRIFGREYEAYYAPLTSEDGQLTGALFVAASK